MPRQVILSALEREALLASPVIRDELIRWYTFSEPDLALIRQRRGDANRLGFAVQLCLLRYPGQGLAADAPPDETVLEWISQTLRIDPFPSPRAGRPFRGTRVRSAATNRLREQGVIWLSTSFSLLVEIQGGLKNAWHPLQGVFYAGHLPAFSAERNSQLSITIRIG